MRTHRIIFWTTLLLFIIGLPIILSINFETDIKNILIGIICSSLVATIVELPSLLNYKHELFDKIYYNLLYSKMFLLQYNFKIEEIINEDNYNYENLANFYLQNIYPNLVSYNNIDNTLFYNFNSKKNIFLDSKYTFYNCFNVVNTQSIELEIVKNRIKLGECTIEDIHKQLKIINNSNNNFISEIDKCVNSILNDKKVESFNENSNKILNKLKEITKH